MTPKILLVGSSALAATFAPFFAGDDCKSSCSSTSAVTAAYEAREGKNIVETAVAAGNFETLAAAVGAAGLVETLSGEGPFTVFAPTDAAFAKLPEGTVAHLLEEENLGTLSSILTYHVVAGELAASDVVKSSFATTVNGQRIDIEVNDGGVFVDGARVVTTDIECSNGIIHVIDSVILPNDQTIVEQAAATDMFSTLVAAVTAAELAEALSSEGPFTVFAPTNEAFAALPEGTVAALLQPENKHQLVSILKYHVIPARVYADQAVAAKRAATLQGSEISARIVDGRLQVSGANVVASDIEASNGVIHVIDSVLLP